MSAAMDNSMTYREKVGAELRALRLSRKLSVRELAERAGVGFTHISAIENGKYNIRLDTIEQLLTALDAEIVFVQKNDE